MKAQLGRFGVVGIAAMLVHWCTVAVIVPLGMVPLLANVVAFLVAFQVSYWGHRHWTFEAADQQHRKTAPRFFAVAVASFLVNEAAYALLLQYTPLDYRVALVLVLGGVAGMTFLLSRHWAFR
ncbi:MAG: GtrA family protein [Alcanivorax sp.]|nr:GtrA family protein [Alcanivorax sp.]